MTTTDIVPSEERFKQEETTTTDIHHTHSLTSLLYSAIETLATIYRVCPSPIAASLSPKSESDSDLGANSCARLTVENAHPNHQKCESKCYEASTTLNPTQGIYHITGHFIRHPAHLPQPWEPSTTPDLGLYFQLERDRDEAYRF